MRRLLRSLVFAERVVAVGLLSVILLFTFTQVIARFVFDSPLGWTDELARFSYVWMTFIAAAAVMAQRGHITVELGDEMLPSRVKTALNVFGMLAVVVACAVIAIGGLAMLGERASGSSTAMGIPLSVFYGTVYGAIVLMGLHALANVIQLLMIARHPDAATAELAIVTKTRPGETL
jgi:TRAP-type transport system small permease protein